METEPRTFFKWDAPSAFELRQRRLANERSVYRAICAAVDVRDGGRCRACDRYVASGARHHHHLVLRSKGRDDSSSNLVLLCQSCHSQAHGSKRLRIEGNADVALAFYRRGQDGRWFLADQEIGVRQFVRVD